MELFRESVPQSDNTQMEPKRIYHAFPPRVALPGGPAMCVWHGMDLGAPAHSLHTLFAHTLFKTHGTVPWILKTVT